MVNFLLFFCLLLCGTKKIAHLLWLKGEVNLNIKLDLNINCSIVNLSGEGEWTTVVCDNTASAP